MKKNYDLIILVIAVSAFACNSGSNQQNDGSKSAAAAFDLQQGRAFIDSMNAKWVEQIRNGDSMSLAGHYSSDAELLMSNSEPIKAKDILSAWGSTVRTGLRDWKFTTTDLQGDSNFLIETGNYEIRDANKKLADRGNYVVIWKKENGEWKLFRDVGVSGPVTSK
jgi:ketosteroid isomerase-like protein